MSARLATLNFSVSFDGREDRHLDSKLKGEISGIIMWALDGLKRLRSCGRFTESAATKEMKEHFDELSNPLHGFVKNVVEWCPKSQELCADVFQKWSIFRQIEGIEFAKSPISFGHSLKTVYPNMQKTRETIKGQRVYVYKGIKFKV